MLHVSLGMNLEQRRVVERLTHLRSRDGGEWKLVLESVGEGGEGIACKSAMWESITPYLHPWHVKKSFTVEDQIRRECRERGFPAVANLDRLPAIRVNGRELRPIHFHRFRSKRDLTQPDARGSFWRIEFVEPIQGPLALGFGCHFGLGMFRAEPGKLPQAG